MTLITVNTTVITRLTPLPIRSFIPAFYRFPMRDTEFAPVFCPKLRFISPTRNSIFHITRIHFTVSHSLDIGLQHTRFFTCILEYPSRRNDSRSEKQRRAGTKK